MKFEKPQGTENTLEKEKIQKRTEENKEEFIKIFTKHVHREGGKELLNFLETSDFFTAPASTRYHGNYEGGLCEHSLNVYYCLKDYLEHAQEKHLFDTNISEETIALVALLHDICKVNLYKVSTRNAKVDGKWVQVPYYEHDDQLPYGHGEKSVYMVSAYMKLSREEAFAIRYHMGFSTTDPAGNVGKSFEMFPLAFATSVADMEATYFREGSPKKE